MYAYSHTIDIMNKIRKKRSYIRTSDRLIRFRVNHATNKVTYFQTHSFDDQLLRIRIPLGRELVCAENWMRQWRRPALCTRCPVAWHRFSAIWQLLETGSTAVRDGHKLLGELLSFRVRTVQESVISTVTNQHDYYTRLKKWWCVKDC